MKILICLTLLLSSLLPVQGFTSPNPKTAAFYKGLIERFKQDQNSVRLKDLNQTFYPMQASPADDRMQICHDQLPIGECAPDTFYSWGPIEKMRKIKESTDQTNWSGPLNSTRLRPNGVPVYVTHTSIGSYCYGEVPVRFKFTKRKSDFDIFVYRGILNNNYFSKTYNDWIIFDGVEVDSVSYAQPEHIDEIITEITRRLDKSQPWFSTSLYIPPALLRLNPTIDERLYQGCVPERRHKLSEKNMVRNVLKLIESYLNGEGWIHYQNCNNCSSVEHFQTTWPSFFNPT